MLDARFELWEATCTCGGANTGDLRMCRCMSYLSPAVDLGCVCHRGVMLPKDGPRGTFWGCSLYKKVGCKHTKPFGPPHDDRARAALGAKVAADAAEQEAIQDPFERNWKRTCNCGGVDDLDTFACHRNYKSCALPPCPKCGAALFLRFANGGDDRWWGCSAWKESGCNFKTGYIPRTTTRPPPSAPQQQQPAPATTAATFGLATALPAPPCAAREALAEARHGHGACPATEMTILECPFAEKDQAKALGARWEPSLKKWYVPAGMDLTPFGRWMASRPWERRDAPAAVLAATAPPPPPAPPPPKAAPPPPARRQVAAPAQPAVQYGGAELVTHDRYGKPLAKPRPPTRREKAAATRGAAHLNSAKTHAALAKAPPTGEEAAVQAISEGLTLVPSDSQTGYKNVSSTGGKKPYTATYPGQRRKGQKRTETFATAEEAALAYARHVGPEASREQAAKAKEALQFGGGKENTGVSSKRQRGSIKVK
jgi:ssDNA-binding Zn-finger/Zn-ribbon topoisomerase 1